MKHVLMLDHPTEPDWFSRLVPLECGVVESAHREMTCSALPAQFKIVVVMTGRLGIERAGTWHDMHAGDFLLMHRRDHSRAAIAYPPQIVYYWALFESTDERPNRQSTPLPDEFASVGRVQRPQRVTDLFQMLVQNQAGGTLDQADSVLLLRLILLECARSAGSTPLSETASDALARRVQTYVADHFQDDISTSSIAAALDINPSYMSRAFRKATGMTPTDCVLRYRLNEARLLLLEDRLTIDQIARRVGFREAGYFRRQFKRSEHQTPSEFRRRHALLPDA